MTDELRALVSASLQASLRAEMAAGRPPDLGDIVAVAIRDGRRIRRNRRIGAGALGVVAVSLGLVAAHRAGPPQAMAAPAPVVAAAAKARTLTVRSGTQRAGIMPKKATSAAMLHLLTTLLPPGRISGYGVAAGDDLLVQVSLDRGYGPAPLRVHVSRAPSPGAPGVTVSHTQGDCTRATAVNAARPDGTEVEIDVPACPATRAALTDAEASRIAADPRWGVTMDGPLVDAGAAQLPGGVPVFAS